MAADVRQRLLGGAVDGQPRVGRELARLAAHLDGDRQAALLPERVGERADAVGPGQLVAARGRDRAARFLQSAGGELVGLVDRARHLRVGAAIGGEQARALQLQRERRE